MSPSEKEFGELIGGVSAMREQLADLQRTNGEEHAANAARVEGLRAEVRDGLGKKADKSDLEDLDEKVDSLRLARAGTSARDAVFKGAFGAALTILAILLGGHVHI